MLFLLLVSGHVRPKVKRQPAACRDNFWLSLTVVMQIFCGKNQDSLLTIEKKLYNTFRKIIKKETQNDNKS